SAIQPSNQFQLHQNVPNPFVEKTTIGFELPEACHATLTIFDAAGKTVTSVAGDFAAGYHEITLDREVLPQAGVLFYRLEAAGNSAVRTMRVGE
ncbi:MAG: T9SS type A sorting domain-containing protein, partial [Bacteroidota bacterium]